MTNDRKIIVNDILEILLIHFKTDYSDKRKKFKKAYDNGISQNEKDILIEFNDSNYPDIRLIEENHYKRLDDKPKADICVYGYYLAVKNGEKKESSKGAINHANIVIAELLKHSGVDYSSQRLKIKKNYDDYLMRGHWHSTVEFENKKFPDLRFIQEDEYDQHMDDEDEQPDYDLFVNGYYIIIE